MVPYSPLLHLTLADFIVRTAYQVGKTPLLPIYAAMLGAGDLFIGTILAVSTATGMVLKPVFGMLSDRRGRKLWLLIGIAIFSIVPFFYLFVETPGELFAIRLIHGLATAIFGPVSLAYIAEMHQSGRAERLGWFAMARSGGYLLAPIIATALLTKFDPAVIFTLIGFVSLMAFLRVVSLPNGPQRPTTTISGGGWQDLAASLRAILPNPAFWFAGLMEMIIYAASYAVRAFLPIYALNEAGFELLTIGLFFTLQEAASMIIRPAAGRIGDRVGYLPVISMGLGVLALGFVVLPVANIAGLLLIAAVLIGTGLGIILPSTVALFIRQTPDPRLAARLGFLGTLRNLGKIAGPLVAGVLLVNMSYSDLFQLAALFTFFAGAMLVGLQFVHGSHARRRLKQF